MRGAIFGVGVLATAMGITIESIYGLWFLCADLVYVILFPQLVSVVYIKWSNTYGSLSGYLVGLTLRLLGGEPLILLPATIWYPGYNPVTEVQLFPFKTLTMLISFGTICAVSYSLHVAFTTERFPRHWDVFQCIVNIPEEIIALKESSDGGEMTAINTKNSLSLNGQINPALKLTKEDLMAESQEPLASSSETTTPSPQPPAPSIDQAEHESLCRNRLGSDRSGL
jgi:high affinity choline transporter 7